MGHQGLTCWKLEFVDVLQGSYPYKLCWTSFHFVRNRKQAKNFPAQVKRNTPRLIRVQGWQNVNKFGPAIG
jgi:hypothetical protein